MQLIFCLSGPFQLMLFWSSVLRQPNSNSVGPRSFAFLDMIKVGGPLMIHASNFDFMIMYFHFFIFLLRTFYSCFLVVSKKNGTNKKKSIARLINTFQRLRCGAKRCKRYYSSLLVCSCLIFKADPSNTHVLYPIGTEPTLNKLPFLIWSPRLLNYFP